MRCLVLIIVVILLPMTGCQRSGEEPDALWGKRGLRPGDFIRPRVVTLGKSSSGQEELYIIDYVGRIQVFTLDGQPLREWKTPEIKIGRPAGACWSNRRQQLLVADSHYQRILIYSREGELVQTIVGTQGEGNLGPFQYVADVAEDDQGNLYVSEFGNENEDRIRKLTPEGNHISSWGSHGTGPQEFSRPRGMACQENELYVTDSSNHRIQVFNLEGKFVRSIGGPGVLQYPYDVALGPTGAVYVVEYGAHRVQKFTAEGKSLGTWGRAGREPGCMFQPWGLSVSQTGKVFVLDSENHRVQQVGW